MSRKKEALIINPPRYDIIPDTGRFNYVINKIKNLDSNTNIFKSIGLGSFSPVFFPFNQPPVLLKIGAVLKKKGYNVKMIDCLSDEIFFNKNIFFQNITQIGNRKCGNYKNEKIREPLYHIGMSFVEFEKRLLALKKSPNEIYLSCNITYYWEAAHEIIRICKKIFPRAKVFFGGVYPSLCTDHAKKSLADIVHVGEWEEVTFAEPDLGLLDFKPNYVVLKTTWGCPNHCSFCAVSILEGRKMKYISPYDLFNTVVRYREKFGINKFILQDSNVLINFDNFFGKFLDLIISSRLDLEFLNIEGFTPDLINQKIAKKLYQAGFRNMTIPYTTDFEFKYKQRFHRQFNKRSFIKAINYLTEAGFKRRDMLIYIMYAMPKQDFACVYEALSISWKLGTIPCLMPFAPVPKTEEYLNIQKKHPKKLENLHPFLWPAADNNMKVVDLKNIYEFSVLSDPALIIKQKNRLTKIEKDIINTYDKIKL